MLCVIDVLPLPWLPSWSHKIARMFLVSPGLLQLRLEYCSSRGEQWASKWETSTNLQECLDHSGTVRHFNLNIKALWSRIRQSICLPWLLSNLA